MVTPVTGIQSITFSFTLPKLVEASIVIVITSVALPILRQIYNSHLNESITTNWNGNLTIQACENLDLIQQCYKQLSNPTDKILFLVNYADVLGMRLSHFRLLQDNYSKQQKDPTTPDFTDPWYHITGTSSLEGELFIRLYKEKNCELTAPEIRIDLGPIISALKENSEAIIEIFENRIRSCKTFLLVNNRLAATGQPSFPTDIVHIVLGNIIPQLARPCQ